MKQKFSFKLLSVIMAVTYLTSSLAIAMDYFESKIDYWNDGKETKDAKIDETKNKSSFPWKTYMDPKNKEFFKEGDYTPPEPFMEVARSPTDENIKNWFEFMHQKNMIAARLNDRIQDYMVSHKGEGVPVVSQPVSAPAPQKAVETKVDPDRFKFRMYFDSTCPHCRKMIGVLSQFQNRGFKVEAVQVDSGPLPPDETIIPVSRGDSAELKKHGIKGVPYLLIADTKRKVLLPAVEGFHDIPEVQNLLQEASRKN